MSSIKNYNKEWKQDAVKWYAEWDKTLYIWKSFCKDQYDFLKSYVGLALYGNPSRDEGNSCDISYIWYKFPSKERKIIDELAEKFIFENSPVTVEKDQVTVAHTYLYLDDGNTVCVFRQMKSNGEVIFIDNIGRVYKSWTHFCETNQLPKCHYVAPDDGLHKIKQTLLEYKSPAASISSKVLKATDCAAAGSTIVGVVLIGLATAPVSAVILGGLSTGYAIGRSIGILVDRGTHKESIGFDNPQSTLSWLTIGTSAITGASSLALSQSALIVENAGNFTNVAKVALQGLNYAALASNVCNFGTYVYLLQKKIENGEKLTALDLMEGCVSLFLIAGAVSNTKQMHKYIKSLETAPTTTSGRLTRSVKKNIQELRDQLSGNSDTTGKMAGVKKVTILEENIPSWGLNFVWSAGQQFLVRHTNIEHIYYKCLDILSTCCDFRYQKIGLVVFFSNITNHIQNLCILVSDAVVSIKAQLEPFLKQYFSRLVPDSLAEQIGHMIENTTTAVRNIDEALIEDEVQPSTENESKLYYEIIFEAAKNRIPETTQTSEIISVFSYQLMSLVSEIMLELNDNYEECVSKNIERLGKADAEKFFSKLGIKTLNDFANLNFIHIMKNKNNVLTNRNVENELAMEKVMTLYKRLLSKVAPQSTLSELDVLVTCQMLKKSLTEFFMPLGERFKCAKDLYEINAQFVGHETAMNLVFDVLNVKSSRSYMMNNSTFFDLAADNLSLDKIARELSAELSDNRETSKMSSQLSDENIQYTVLSLCDKFYRKVESKLHVTSDTKREERVKDCYRYLMEKFTSSIQNMEKDHKTELSDCFEVQNEAYFDRQKFISVFRKACETKKYEMFASAVEYFTREENLATLAEEYIATRRNFENFFVDLCTEINKEDGVRMYSIDEGSFLNFRTYKRHAASLFDLNEGEMELIKWEKGVVILKCGLDRNIVFQTVDTKSMIAMELDTSKNMSRCKVSANC